MITHLKPFTIYCYEWNDNGGVSLATSYYVSGPTDSVGMIESGKIAFKNLDKNKKYYFQFMKTQDDVPALLYAKISNS